jgi:hypothetical protein
MEEEVQRRERHFVLQVSTRNALSRTNFIPDHQRKEQK